MAVDYETFVSIVEEEANLPRQDAERAVEATLHTLAERISLGQVEDLAAELPDRVRTFMHDGHDPEAFSAGEFVHRVARREGVGDDVARQHARAVFAALSRAVSQKEIDDMRAQLSSDYGELLSATARRRKPRPERQWPADEFLGRVVELTGLDRDGARRATEAVLEALAVRITAGEAEDIELMLAPELRDPLERGKVAGNGAAVPLKLDEFLQLIADSEGVSIEAARVQARAVFAVLREAIGEKEFADAFAQLPDDYAVITGHP